MSYEAYLNRCLDEYLGEDQYCEDCGHMECICDDDCIDTNVDVASFKQQSKAVKFCELLKESE